MTSDNGDSIERFFGNGTVYLTDRDSVRTLRGHNFDVESMRDKAWGECWITDEIIVALGCDVSPRKAIKGLRKVIAMMESDLTEGKCHT
jgi:hypothetical protein